MALQLPSEIVVQRFLPTVRSMLATELDAHGMTQREIAERLGVTQASVSNYLGDEGMTDGDDPFRADDRMQATVERIASGFATGSMDDFEALSALLSLIRTFENRGPICAVHEEEMPALRGLGCDLCVRGPDDAVAAERDVLSSVRRATRLLGDAPAVVEHIPNVGTNVAMALPDADDALDVAAVPGRIHALRGRVNVASNPEFGASKHVAGVVLAAMSVDSTRRGAVNLATSNALLDAARTLDVEPLVFDADYEHRGDELRTLFEANGVPSVVYHLGEFGIEPVTYVLGETAVDAVDRAIALVAAAES